MRCRLSKFHEIDDCGSFQVRRLPHFFKGQSCNAYYSFGQYCWMPSTYCACIQGWRNGYELSGQVKTSYSHYKYTCGHARLNFRKEQRLYIYLKARSFYKFTMTCGQVLQAIGQPSKSPHDSKEKYEVVTTVERYHVVQKQNSRVSSFNRYPSLSKPQIELFNRFITSFSHYIRFRYHPQYSFRFSTNFELISLRIIKLELKVESHRCWRRLQSEVRYFQTSNAADSLLSLHVDTCLSPWWSTPLWTFWTLVLCLSHSVW